MPFVNQSKTIIDSIRMQVLLLEQLERPCHLVQSYRPILPLLISSYHRIRLALHQIISPSSANQNCITPQGFNELFVLLELRHVLLVDLKFCAMTADLIDWKSPPVIVTMVYRIVVLQGIQFFELEILLNALPNDHLTFSFSSSHHNNQYALAYSRVRKSLVLVNFLGIKPRLGAVLGDNKGIAEPQIIDPLSFELNLPQHFVLVVLCLRHVAGNGGGELVVVPIGVRMEVGQQFFPGLFLFIGVVVSQLVQLQVLVRLLNVCRSVGGLHLQVVPALGIGLNGVLTNLCLDLDAKIALGFLVVESRRFYKGRFLGFPLLLLCFLDAGLVRTLPTHSKVIEKRYSLNINPGGRGDLLEAGLLLHRLLGQLQLWKVGAHF